MGPDIRVMGEGFGGLKYKDVTLLHPLALTMLIVMGIAIIFLNRKWAITPLLIMACFISSVQKITILGMDFNLLRIMILFGALRLFIRKEYSGFKFKTLDKVLIAWIFSSIVIYTVQYGNISAFIYRMGFAFDAFGLYFLFRCLIQEWRDIDKTILVLAVISIPVAFLFIIENKTGRNLFSIFGGVPKITIIRDERLRCQGAFPHPIIAGCFWAALIPLFTAYWWKSDKARFFSVIGVVSSLIIVFCSASSTPLLGVIAALIGGLFFALRRQMKLVRWSLLAMLIALHLVMEAPVWALVSRVSAVGGSTGYFRYMLIDSAISNFGEWALLGTKSTAHWFWGAQDVCNQYVLEAVEGGLLTLILFILLFTIGFKDVGRLWRLNRRNSYRQALSWAFGVGLFVHCMCFIGVSYFGQIWVVLYLLFAMIESMNAKHGSHSV